MPFFAPVEFRIHHAIMVIGQISWSKSTFDPLKDHEKNIKLQSKGDNTIRI